MDNKFQLQRTLSIWKTYGFLPKFFGLEKYTRCSTFEFEFKGEKWFFLRRYHSPQRTNLNQFLTSSFLIKKISYLQFYEVAGSKVQKMLNKLKFIVQLGLLYTFISSLLCRRYELYIYWIDFVDRTL